MEEIIAAIFVLLFFIIILGTCVILLLYRLSALEEKFEILSDFQYRRNEEFANRINDTNEKFIYKSPDKSYTCKNDRYNLSYKQMITMQDVKSNLIMLEEYLKIKKVDQSEKTYYIKGDK